MFPFFPLRSFFYFFFFTCYRRREKVFLFFSKGRKKFSDRRNRDSSVVWKGDKEKRVIRANFFDAEEKKNTFSLFFPFKRFPFSAVNVTLGIFSGRSNVTFLLLLQPSGKDEDSGRRVDTHWTVSPRKTITTFDGLSGLFNA